jgi:hypothetical protein
MSESKKKIISKLKKDPATIALSRTVNEDVFENFKKQYRYKCNEFKLFSEEQKEVYENIMNNCGPNDKFQILDKKVFTSASGGVTIFLEYYEAIENEEKKTDDSKNNKEEEKKEKTNTPKDEDPFQDIEDEDDEETDIPNLKNFMEDNAQPLEPIKLIDEETTEDDEDEKEDKEKHQNTEVKDK